MARRSPLPDFESIWARIQAHAEICRREKRPIYTLKRKVRNFITDVQDESIGRRSDDGRSKPQSRVTKGQVRQVWEWLCGRRPNYNVLYFVPALMADALQDLLEHDDGVIRLK